MRRALRGIPLVEAAIAAAKVESPKSKWEPIARGLATKLHFAGKRAVPASLVRWLEHDVDWLELEISKTGEIATTTVGGLLGELFPEVGEWPELDLLLPKPVVHLPGGTDSFHFLYLGTPDKQGEYPVMVVDTDDTPYVTIYSPGFDVWIAESWDALDGWDRATYESMFTHRAFGAATKAQAKANLHGRKGFDVQDALPRTVKKPKAKPKAKPGKAKSVVLPAELEAAITALAKRRRKHPREVTIAAIELAVETLGKLDEPLAIAVHKFCSGPRYNDGQMAADLYMLQKIPSQIRKELRLHRKK